MVGLRISKIFTDGSYIYGSKQDGEKIQNLVDTENLSSILQVFRTYAVLSGQVEKQGIKL